MDYYSKQLMNAAITKAGEAALKYCIDNGLAGWYVTTRVKHNFGSSNCLVSGPYTTYQEALDMCIYDGTKVEFLTKEEAQAITY